jgi:hypothetical protein
LAKVEDKVMVDVLEADIAAELFAREAKRIKAGGGLPRFEWRAVKFKAKGRRTRRFTVTTGEPLPKAARTRSSTGAFPANTVRGPKVGIER